MQDQSYGSSFCPSFNSYSSDQLADIAARVGEDERRNFLEESIVSENQNGIEDDDFEFVLVQANPHASVAVSGGEQDSPVFPLFNRDLLLDDRVNDYLRHDREQGFEFDDEVASSIGVQLKKLFLEERDPASSSSSSEADELEGIPTGSYCVWRPKPSIGSSPSPGRCKKSNSTGSSSKPRWRLRDLLRRSSSDGKDSFVFLHPSNNNKNSANDSNSGTKKEEKVEKAKTVTAGAKAKSKEKVSAHEAFYVRNKALKEGDKRRSYLPYRQDLVGLFASVNGMGKTFPRS